MDAKFGDFSEMANLSTVKTLLLSLKKKNTNVSSEKSNY